MVTSDRSFGFTRLRRRPLLTAAALAAASLLVAGCGGPASSSASSDSAAPAPTAASPSPNATDTAKAQLLTAYQGFWNIQVQAYSSGSLNGIPINKYALGPAFYDIKQTVLYYQQNHEVMRGRPTLSPTVTALQITKEPFSAKISDCVDTSNFLPVDSRTGKPAQLESSVHRHPWTFTATFDNVLWYITNADIDRTRTC